MSKKAMYKDAAEGAIYGLIMGLGALAGAATVAYLVTVVERK
jgi:hypothetical protein